MTEIKEVRCPGCGKEMRRHRYDCGRGARIAWYECEICGWRAPMCADDNRAYEMAMRRCGDNDTTAVDAEPVRRGKWEMCRATLNTGFATMTGTYPTCSLCGYVEYGVDKSTPYCPGCGAKMEGVEK